MFHEDYGLAEALRAFVGFNCLISKCLLIVDPDSRSDHYLRHAVLMVEDRSKKRTAESSESHLTTFYWLK